MVLKVRTARTRDLWEVARIDSATFKTPWTFPNFVDQFEHNRDGFLVAEEHGKVVGFSLADPSGLLMLIAVKEEKRGRGTGSLLLQHSLRFLRDKAEKALVHVRESEELVTRFYLKHGFKKEKLLKDYYSDGNGWLLTKKL